MRQAAPADRRRVPRARAERHPRGAAGRHAGQHPRGRPRPEAPPARLRQRPADADRARPGALDAPGIRYGRTLGSPLGFAIDNRDWASWTERMSIEPIPAARRPKPITLARPGHADLAGAIKYDTDDIRDVLERASARSTAPRVAAGALCRQLLAHVRRADLELRRPARARSARSPTRTTSSPPSPMAGRQRDRREPTPLRCPDPDAEAAMLAEVDAAIEAGDSIGGSFVVVAEGMPIGLGSNAEWDTRLDGALAGGDHGDPGRQGRRDRPRLRRGRPARQRGPRRGRPGRRRLGRARRTAPAASRAA